MNQQTPQYRDPHKEHKACRGCKILEKTNCEVLDIVDNWEFISGKPAKFIKCHVRPFAIRLMKMDAKNGKHYERVGK